MAILGVSPSVVRVEVWGLVDIGVIRDLGASPLRENLRDRRRQRRLAVINVTNRANVAMRLCPFKLLFRHSSRSLELMFVIC